MSFEREAVCVFKDKEKESVCDRERVKERGWVHSKERECTLEQECVLVRVPSGMGVCMRMCVWECVCVHVCVYS